MFSKIPSNLLLRILLIKCSIPLCHQEACLRSFLFHLGQVSQYEFIMDPRREVAISSTSWPVFKSEDLQLVLQYFAARVPISPPRISISLN